VHVFTWQSKPQAKGMRHKLAILGLSPFYVSTDPSYPSAMLPRRNVLIFHLGALGDFVLTWPLALSLARLYPQSRVFYVTHQSKGKLAEKALRLDSLDIEDGWHALFGDPRSLPPPAVRSLQSAHTLVSFLSNGTDTWAQNARTIAPDATLITLHPPTLTAPPVGEHAIRFIEKQLASWPAIGTAMQQIVRSIADRGIGGRAIGDGSVVIHPGSGSAAKCWPIEKFVELGTRFQATGKRVRFVVGEPELERWPASALDRLATAGELVRSTDLPGLWEIIRSASLFIGNDSGPGHLAAMAGVKAIILFGPTSPEVWKPLGPAVTALRKEPLASLTVEEIFAEI
jgi:heptosyltransferase-3